MGALNGLNGSKQLEQNRGNGGNGGSGVGVGGLNNGSQLQAMDVDSVESAAVAITFSPI